MDGAGSYSVAHRAGLLPTELTGMYGWILLRSPHQGKGSPPAPAPTKHRPARESRMRYPLGTAPHVGPSPGVGYHPGAACSARSKRYIVQGGMHSGRRDGTDAMRVQKSTVPPHQG